MKFFHSISIFLYISGNVQCSLIVMLRTTTADSTMQAMYLSDMNLVLDDPLLNGTPLDKYSG